MKKGQKVRTSFNKGIYTIDYFFGPDGEPHDTVESCKKANPQGLICVSILETGGAAAIDSIFPAQDEKQ